MENWSKIALFSPKMSQKALRGPLGPPRMTKIIFSSCQDTKTPCQKKEFLSYLQQKKSQSAHTRCLAAILEIEPKKGVPHLFFSGLLDEMTSQHISDRKITPEKFLLKFAGICTLRPRLFDVRQKAFYRFVYLSN